MFLLHGAKVLKNLSRKDIKKGRPNFFDRPKPHYSNPVFS
jgi:hypothetical protein